VKLPAQGSPLIAIRVSIPVDEGYAEAGAGRLLETLASQRVQGRAAALGLHFEGARTPWGLAYTVAGARSELDDLVSLIREAVGEPELLDVDFERRRRALADEALRTTETPAARIFTELRTRVAPGSPPIDGTLTSLERLTRVTLRELWARTHHPASMTVVVSGDVADEQLTAALRGFGAPAGSAGDGGSSAALQSPAVRGTQVFRHWYGEAFRLTDTDDPHGAVVALLAADRLRGSPEPFEAEVQLIELESVQLLAVLAAAYSGEASRMRERIPLLLSNTRQGLTTERVQTAVARVRQDLLQQARTPAGLVTVVGRHLDSTGDPLSARLFLTALDRVTLQSTNAFMSGLERQPPIRAEVRP
jgi:predicted Zn-dependent peptidase